MLTRARFEDEARRGVIEDDVLSLLAQLSRDLAGEIDGAIRYLVVTQGHVDHVGGVQFFRDRNPGLQLIAQANNEEHQTYDTRLAPFRQARSAFRFADAFPPAFQAYAEAGYTKLNPQDRPTADIHFEDRHELSLGGLDVVLRVAILEGLFRTFGIETLEASPGALREGLLYDLLGRIHQEDVRGSSVVAFGARLGIDEMQAARVMGTATALYDEVADLRIDTSTLAAAEVADRVAAALEHGVST